MKSSRETQSAFSVNNFKRRRTMPVLLTATSAALGALSAGVTFGAGNTVDVFSAGTSMLTTSNWSLNAVPLIGNDAEFGTALPAATKTLTATLTGSGVYGSLDDINVNGAITVGDGTTVATAAPLTLGGSGDLGNSVSGTAADLIYTATGATLNLVPNTSTGTGVLSIVLGQAGVFDSAGTLSITAGISGSFGVTKTGVGSLTLGGTNTYTGGVTLSAGTLNINSTSALGTTAGVFNIGAGTTLDNTTSATVTTNAIPVNLGSAFTFKGTSNLTLGGLANISSGSATSINVSAGTLTFGNYLANGSGGTITKLGAGTLSLGSFNNTFTANINLSGGTLQIYGGANLGNSANVVTAVANSTIQFSNPVGVAGGSGIHVFNTGSSTLTLDTSLLTATVGLGNAIIGSGNIAKTGSTQLNLNAANTYTGTTSINGGTLNLGTSGSVQSSGLIFNGGTFAMTAMHNFNQSFGSTTFNSGSNAINIPSLNTSGGATTLSLGTLARTSPAVVDFTLPSAGSITTTSTNASFTGGQATILGGYATVGGSTWATITGGTIGGLSSYDTTFAVPGADLDVTGPVNQDPSVSAINSVRFNTAATTSLNVSAGGLAIATGGVLVTSNVGANTANISGGSLTSNNGSDLTVIQNNTAAPLIITSAIMNASDGTSIGLTKAGAGTLIIGGTNTNTGPTNIVAGTLIVGNGGTTEALGSGAVIDNATLGFNRSGTTTFSNTISGSGTLQMNGIGTLVLPITTSYSGGTFPNAGVIQFATTNDAGSGYFNFSGGAIRETTNLSSGRLFYIGNGGGTIDVSTYYISGTSQPSTVFSLTGATSITGPGTFNVNNPTTSSTTGIADGGTLSVTTLTSALTGNVNVNAGELLLTGTANTYAGSFNVTAGSVLYGYAGGSFGTAGIILGAGKLEVNNSSTTTNYASTLVSTVALNSASSIVQVGTSIYPNTLTASGLISGTGMLNKTGPGAIIFTNSTANTYSGGTTVYQGLLASSVSGSFSTGDLLISPNQTAGTALDNATVNASTGSLATTANVTLASEVGDTNANGSTYGLALFNVTGPLQIASLAGAGQVNFSNVSGNTLTISGSVSTTFSGNITASNVGNGALVKSGVSSLTLGGSNTYTGGTNVSGGSLIIASAGALPLGGDLTVGPTASVIINNLGSPAGFKVGALNLTGTVNLNNNLLVVHNGTLAGVSANVSTGFNGGGWNGPSGIISSTAANDTTHLTALGVIQNSADGTTGGTVLNASLDGLTGLVASDVLVKFTYYGDANLDGKVDGSDYSRIDSSFLSEQTGPAVTGWFNGDFNYDNVVDGSDYTLIDNAFNSQSTVYSAELATPTAQVAGTSAVPEPATLGLLGLGAMGLLGRRRKV